MEQLFIIISFALLHTTTCGALSMIPSNTSALFLPDRWVLLHKKLTRHHLPHPNPHSISNKTTLAAPSSFSIEFSTTHDFGPPMDEIAIYMNAVTALEDLCFRDQSAHLPGYPHNTWSLPQYDLYIEVSAQQVRYAIWGLQLTAGAVRKAGFWPIIGRVFWREDFAGRVDVANCDFPLDSVELVDRKQGRGDVRSNGTVGVGGSGIFLNSTVAVDLLDTARLTIVPRYDGAAISARSVFGTAINVMVLGAENGPNTYCLRLVRPEVEVVTEYDAGGNPLLKYKYLIRSMRMLTTWMVEMDRFGEIDVDVRRDGILIGRARIRSRVRLSAS